MAGQQKNYNEASYDMKQQGHLGVKKVDFKTAPIVEIVSLP